MCRQSHVTNGGAANGRTEPGKRVMLWGPPRSLSTAVERALVEHPDIQVIHEPFGVPHYWSSEAASSRNASESRKADTFAMVAKRLWHNPLNAGKVHLFSKNLSYYFAPHCLPTMHTMLGGDYSRVVHSFIIRHPAKAIASLYYKSCIDNEKTGYTHFDRAEAGYTAMRDILAHVEQQPGCPPVVIIDADDMLEDPEGIVSAYCEAVGLPFKPSMLSWTPGPCKELESPWTGWTDDVLASSGITKRPKRSMPPNVDTLPQDVRETIAEAMPIYVDMFARRLRPKGSAAAAADASALPAELVSSARAKTGGASLVGSLLLGLSVIIWVAQAELLQDIASDEWNKPYAQAILLKSVWAITLPICACARPRAISRRDPPHPRPAPSPPCAPLRARLSRHHCGSTPAALTALRPSATAAAVLTDWCSRSRRRAGYALHTVQKAMQDEITFRRPLKPTWKVIFLGVIMMLFTQSASATWIASLSLTAVSVNTAIYNVNPLLVYVFSVPILQESLSLTKTVAVLGALVATTMVAQGTRYDPESITGGERGLQGVLTVLASATIYSLKEVFFKRVFPSVSVSLTPFTDSLLVVAIIGVASVLTMVPMIALLDYSGFEPFVMPPPEVARSYGVVALLMAVYQACLLAAIALTTPTFVAMGTMLTVPISMLYDFFARGYVVPTLSQLGIVGIVAAFAVLIFSEQVDASCAKLGQASDGASNSASNGAKGKSSTNGATAMV